jgi:hypothetical protein
MTHPRMIGIDWGDNQIRLLRPSGMEVVQARPVAIHHKSDGAADDGPSFAIVLDTERGCLVFGEVTLKMLNKALGDINYEIRRKP